MFQKISKKNIDRILNYAKRNGALKTCYKIAERLKRDDEEKDYSRVFIESRPDENELKRQRNHVFSHPYRISILVPAYESNPVFFKQMLNSVIRQTYADWELCIADGSEHDDLKKVVMNVIGQCPDRLLGSRIKYQKLSENKGISGNTNVALSMASGDYIALLDHDDILEENALFEVMKVLDEGIYREGTITLNRTLLIYSDEDKVNADQSRYFDHHRKPDFDIDLLRSNNYICHFLVVDSSVARKTGGFLQEYDGAQDHDFIFRCVEQLKEENIKHIPRVLYHWRTSDMSTADNPESKLYAYASAKKAIEAHLKRLCIEAEVEETPHLGFFRVKYADRGLKCITMTEEEFKSLGTEEIKSRGADAVMILNGDIEPLTKDYLKELSGVLFRKEVGAVSGKILDSRNRIESAGYTFDGEGKLIPENCGLNSHFSGYMHRASIQHKTCGLPADCRMVKTEALTDDSKDRIKAGYICVYDPFAVFRRKNG